MNEGVPRGLRVDSSKNLLFTKHLQQFVGFLLCPFLHLNANPLLVRNGTQTQILSEIIIIIILYIKMRTKARIPRRCLLRVLHCVLLAG